ncbi:MAG TPA: hypothetical protein VF341_07980 [Anaeromyxobacteraceae bacterium]
MLEAIKAHSSPAGVCVTTTLSASFVVNGILHEPRSTQQYCNGSEANGVVNNFNALGSEGQQDFLDFLRSL